MCTVVAYIRILTHFKERCVLTFLKMLIIVPGTGLNQEPRKEASKNHIMGSVWDMNSIWTRVSSIVALSTRCSFEIMLFLRLINSRSLHYNDESSRQEITYRKAGHRRSRKRNKLERCNGSMRVAANAEMNGTNCMCLPVIVSVSLTKVVVCHWTWVAVQKRHCRSCVMCNAKVRADITQEL